MVAGEMKHLTNLLLGAIVDIKIVTNKNFVELLLDN